MAKELTVGGKYPLISLDNFKGDYGVGLSAWIRVDGKERMLILPSIFGRKVSEQDIEKINQGTGYLLVYKGPAGRTHLFKMEKE